MGGLVALGLGPIEVRRPEDVFGTRIREFRIARRLTLRALALQTRLSAGFLSQLERGQVNASVGTLRRLADGLGVTLPDLFGDEDIDAPRVLRRADRPHLQAGELTAKYLLSQKPLRNLEVYSGELLPGGSAGDAYAHGDAQEMLICTRGDVCLELAGVEYALTEGDSAEYRSSLLHTVRNTQTHVAEVLWIVSPATSMSARPGASTSGS